MEDIFTDLKESLDPTELPQKGGNHPLRTNGTCFVAHKVKALERMIDRYGAYLGHLKALTLDASVKSVDREKIKGYLKQWGEGKVLLGCALFVDVLKPASILCKVLQDNEVCVYQVIESTMKTKSVLEKLKATPFKELPTISSGKQEQDGSITYQGYVVKRFVNGMEYFSSNFATLAVMYLQSY